MLVIHPRPVCAHELGVPPTWHSHSWLCSVQPAPPVRERATDPAPAWPRPSNTAIPRTQLATHLESYSCTRSKLNNIRIILLHKSTGGHPPGGIMLQKPRFSAKPSRISTCANSDRNSRRICTYGFIGLKPPLESALA